MFIKKNVYLQIFMSLFVCKKYNLLHINSKRNKNKDKLENNTHKEISGALLGSESL